MNLRILVPFGVFATVTGVTSLVAETSAGAFGILPHRLDCVAAIAPGILTYTAQDVPAYLAMDAGVLVKQGSDVTVAVRHCIRGTALEGLHDAVTRQFLAGSDQDRAVRTALTTMEAGLVGRFVELHRER